MTVQTILNRLDKVRNSGQDKWRIPCPVHNGKDFNMSIKECSDGTVLAHCFVCGADGPALCEALGLPLAEIFPPDNNYVRPVITKKMQQTPRDKLKPQQPSINALSSFSTNQDK